MKKYFKTLFTSILFKFNIIELSVRLNFAYLTVKIALIKSTFINTNSNCTVICLGRPIFNEDILTMSELSGRINYHIIPKEVFIAIFNYFLHDIPRDGIHTKYHKITDYEKQKLQYRKYLDRMFNIFSRVIKVDAVISGNYVYAWQQEIAQICLNKGIPFVVLQKEGLTSQNNYLDAIKTYTNNRFIGTKLLVYNNNIKNAFLQLKVKGLTSEMITTVGPPRLDRYFSIKPNGKGLVFFSFHVKSKINHFEIDKEIQVEYVERAKKFHIQIMKFALRNKDIRVVIKTKESQRYYDDVINIAKENNFINLKNLFITNKANTYELIENSSCVIGFNSLVLIEGLIANKTLITTKPLTGGVSGYFDEFPSLINYANNCYDIENFFYRGNKNNNNESHKNSFLKEFIYKNDGKSSQRAEDSIVNTIKQ